MINKVIFTNNLQVCEQFLKNMHFGRCGFINT